MSSFDAAVPVILNHEGGIGNMRGDPGGLTAWGWSTAECRVLGIPLPSNVSEAVSLYQKYFWNPLYGHIVSQNVCTKLLDDEVNQGQGTGVKNLQNALCMAGSIVKVDGVFGNATLTASILVPEEMLLPWMRMQQWESYRDWIGNNPDRIAMSASFSRRAAWPDPDGTIAPQLLAGTYNPKGQ